MNRYKNLWTGTALSVLIGMIPALASSASYQPFPTQSSLNTPSKGGISPTEQLLERIRTNSKRQAADAAYQLGMASVGRNELEKAQELISEAIFLVPDQAEFHRIGTRVAFTQGRFEQAETHHRSFMALAQNTLEDNDLKTARLMDELGTILMARKHLEDAGQVFTHALEIREQALSAHHPEVVLSYNNLAKLAMETDRAADAEQHFLRALGILKQVAADQPPLLVAGLLNLAEFYRLEARYTDAEIRYQEAIDIAGADRKKNGMELAMAMSGLGKLYVAQENYEQAEEQYKALYEHLKSSLDDEHPLLVEVRDALTQLQHWRDQAAATDGVYRALVQAFATVEERAQRNRGETTLNAHNSLEGTLKNPPPVIRAR